MARSSTLALRRIWFSLHKWIGLLLAALIVPIALSGSALVWHDWLDEAVNPERRVEAVPMLPPSDYAGAAKSHAAADERLQSLAFPDGMGAVVATLVRPPVGEGRPVRVALYLDPRDSSLLDRSFSNAGIVRTLHVLHGSLMVPGLGRQIVGWVGVAMLLSSISGIWLWWPIKGGVRRGLRWKRQPAVSGNIHHQAGFWIVLPLAVLSLTGAWISFPAFFAALSGEARVERPRQAPDRPLQRPTTDVDEVLTLAALGGAMRPASIEWPTERKSEWRVTLADSGGAIPVDDRTGSVGSAEPPRPDTLARTMRHIHDGTGMGPVWQTIIFIGGIVPALLAVTGVLMWIGARKRRDASADRRAARNVGKQRPVAAE